MHDAGWLRTNKNRFDNSDGKPNFIESGQMVTIGMNYKVLPGKEEIFEKAFNNVLNVMAEIEGHTESFLFKDVNSPTSYLITSKWTAEDAFKEFIASERFKKVADWGKENILAGRPQHTVYT